MTVPSSLTEVTLSAGEGWYEVTFRRAGDSWESIEQVLDDEGYATQLAFATEAVRSIDRAVVGFASTYMGIEEVRAQGSTTQDVAAWLWPVIGEYQEGHIVINDEVIDVPADE